MGGIVSRTLPENCALGDRDSSLMQTVVKRVLRETSSLNHKLAYFPQARVRKHVIEESCVASVDEIERKVDSKSPEYCYEQIDIENPFKKRGLLMADFVQSTFEDTFRELFFYENYSGNQCRDRLLLEAAKKDEAVKYTILQSANFNPGTLYMIEVGKVVVSVNKKIIRRLTAPITYREWLEQGGENKDVDIGPSNASVLIFTCSSSPLLRVASEKAILWGLRRDDFRGIVSLMSIAAAIQRSVWLSYCEEIAYLGRANVMKLVHNLERENYKDGEILYLKDKVGSKIMLIESGTPYIELSPDLIEQDLSTDEIDELLGIIRPSKRVAVNDMTTAQIIEFFRFHAKKTGNDFGTPAPCEIVSFDPYVTKPPAGICELTPGCIIGAGK